MKKYTVRYEHTPMVTIAQLTVDLLNTLHGPENYVIKGDIAYITTPRALAN